MVISSQENPLRRTVNKNVGARAEVEMKNPPTYVIDGKVYTVVPLPRSAGPTRTGKATKKMKRTAELFGTKKAKLAVGK